MARSSVSSMRPQHPSFLSRPMRVGYVRTEISPHKQSHPFRDSPLLPFVSLAENLPPLRPLHSPSSIRPTRRELHSRVYHCPDNNDLPTGELLRVDFGRVGECVWWGCQRRETRWAPWQSRRRRRDGQPPCIREYFTLTALRGIGWPRPETLHRFGIMDLYITYSS